MLNCGASFIYNNMGWSGWVYATIFSSNAGVRVMLHVTMTPAVTVTWAVVGS